MQMFVGAVSSHYEQKATFLNFFDKKNKSHFFISHVELLFAEFNTANFSYTIT